uniref:Ubiquitin-like protease family profile domain-containing protein n=1 Tax=Brassica oleracea var. oleracea TaxID=109376 RepID=A0A0D3E9U1_BRAOL
MWKMLLEKKCGTLYEFENITALNCAPFVENEYVVETKVHKGLWKKLNVNRKSPCKKELRGALEDVFSWSTEDKIRFTYLSVLATIIIGEDDEKKLPLELSRMVFDLTKLKKHPLGKKAFKRLIASVKRVNLNANSYTLDGNVIINQAAPIVWEDKSVDKKVDALLEAIHKEGGLGLVTWVDHGTNIIQTAKNIEKNDGEKAEYANEKSDGKETSLKHKTEVIRMKMELVQQAKKVETLECKLEEMGKQLRSYEIMRIRIDLLELEVMLLTEKSKTNEVRRPRQGIPQMLKTGDCGIYAIKFIECHALGAEFTTSLSDENIMMVREKLAAEIFEETEQHGPTVSNPLPLRASDRELIYPY